MTRNGGVDVTVTPANGKPMQLKVNIENGEIKFVPATKADTEALAHVDDELRWKTYEQLRANDKALIKNKPVNPKTKVVEPEVIKPQEPEVKPGVLSEAELNEIINEAYINDRAFTWNDAAAEAFLAKHNAKAMYVPSQPGRPGTLIFSKTATRAEVAEEMLHLKQHKSLKFAQLSTAQIIALEIEAQTELMAFARRNGNDADAAMFEENLAYWQKQKTQLELGGDVAKVVEGEVSGFKMADEPGKLNLGKFVKKIGDYEVYENGELFYRTMDERHYKRLIKEGKLRGTGETSTSPNQHFSEGYEGCLVKFQLKHGTLDKLIANGIAMKNHEDILLIFPTLKPDYSPWNMKYTRFKLEGEQINIALGKGPGLDAFNEGIINFEFIKKITKNDLRKRN